VPSARVTGLRQAEGIAVTKRTEAAKTEKGRREKPRSSSTQRLPVDVQCPPRTDGVECSVLVGPTRRKLSADETRAAAIPAVETAVSEACRWGTLGDDWTVGDYRFVIFEFWPAKGDCLYVQLWTEPDEPVVVEACSGAWTPPARKYVRAPQRTALRALGYEVGGRARNFEKRRAVSSPRDARALARELVEILVDVFGYRGRQPLGMKYFAGGRTNREPVFNGLVVDDVKRMLAIAGMTAHATGARPRAESAGGVDSSPQSGGEQSSTCLAVPRGLKRRLLEVDKPFPFLIELVLNAKTEPLTYNGLRLISGIDSGVGLLDADIVSINNQMYCGRIQRDSLGQVVFMQELWLGGITVGWFISMMKSWQHLRKHAVRLVRPTHRAHQASGAADAEAAADTDCDACDVDERPAARPRTVVH